MRRYSKRIDQWCIYRLDEGALWGFPWLRATCWRFCRKTQKEPTKFVFCVRLLCTVYGTLFPPVAETCARLAGNFCQYRTWQQLRLGQMVWVGWLPAISQLGSRVGERDGVGHWQICLHSITQPYTTWPRWCEQGGVLRSLLLGWINGTDAY